MAQLATPEELAAIRRHKMGAILPDGFDQSRFGGSTSWVPNWFSTPVGPYETPMADPKQDPYVPTPGPEVPNWYSIPGDTAGADPRPVPVTPPSRPSIIEQATRIMEEQGIPVDPATGQPAPPPPAAPGKPPFVYPDRPHTPTPRPEEVLPPPEVAAPAQADPVDDIERLKTMLQELYPKRDQSISPEQAKVDAEAGRIKERTNLLAQLAMAGGLTAAGGGSWKSVGQGMIAAGQVYDEGFEKYQNALQSNADRAMRSRDQEYADQTSMTSAALKLYAAQQAAKNKGNSLTDFRERLLLQRPKAEDFKSADGLEIDQGEYEEALRKWEERANSYANDGVFYEADVSD